jgi:hypothetical protein
MTIQINSAEAALTILEGYVSQAPGFDKDLLAACAYLRCVTRTPAPGDIDSRLAEIEARANEAEQGPWELSFDDGYYIESERGAIVDDIGSANNGYFIAHSREDIPFLLDEIKRLRGLLVSEDALTARIKELETGLLESNEPFLNQLFQRMAVTDANSKLHRKVTRLEQAIARLLASLEKAGIRTAFDLAVFWDLNDALNEAALLVEKNAKNGDGQ